MTKLELNAILQDLCRVFMDLYGVRDVQAITRIGTPDIPATVHFHATLPSGGRIHAHALLLAKTPDEIPADLQRAVRNCSEQISQKTFYCANH